MRLAALPQSEPREEPLGLQVLDSDDAPADPIALARLREGLADADLAAPPVALPDFHFKDDKEMPSSIAVATRHTIRPTLTSASVNCGMTLIATDLPRPDAASITAFYRGVRERYPYPPSYRRDLTTDEVLRCAAEGSDYAAARFEVDPAELERVEERGRLDVERYGGLERVRRELPWSVLQLSRIRFGTIGPSNHFAELQEVEEILDGHAAELLGVSLGQTTLQFHGGGGSLPGELGMLFGRRKRYPRPVRIQMAVQKPLYHFGRARTLAELRLRKQLYFADHYPPVDRDGAEGERLMLANAMAMNYGFAFRLSTYASLQALLRRTFGPTESKLVVDSPHNSIYEEEINGEPALVHRHNAARAYPADRVAGASDLQSDRPAAAASRDEPDLFLSLCGRRRGGGEPLLSLPWRRRECQGVRPARPVSARSQGQNHTSLQLLECRADRGSATRRSWGRRCHRSSDATWRRAARRPSAALRRVELRRVDESRTAMGEQLAAP